MPKKKTVINPADLLAKAAAGDPQVISGIINSAEIASVLQERVIMRLEQVEEANSLRVHSLELDAELKTLGKMRIEHQEAIKAIDASLEEAKKALLAGIIASPEVSGVKQRIESLTHKAHIDITFTQSIQIVYDCHKAPLLAWASAAIKPHKDAIEEIDAICAKRRAEQKELEARYNELMAAA